MAWSVPAERTLVRGRSAHWGNCLVINQRTSGPSMSSFSEEVFPVDITPVYHSAGVPQFSDSQELPAIDPSGWPCHPAWQPGQAEIAAFGGAGRPYSMGSTLVLVVRLRSDLAVPGDRKGMPSVPLVGAKASQMQASGAAHHPVERHPSRG